MVAKLEELFQSFYFYFSSFPWWHLDFTKIMEIEGLNFLINVKTLWISTLEPLKHVLAEYKTLITKMSLNNLSIVQARLNLDLLWCSHIVGLVLTLFVTIIEVCQFFDQIFLRKECFICNFVVVVKNCQADILMMYIDPMMNY